MTSGDTGCSLNTAGSVVCTERPHSMLGTAAVAIWSLGPGDVLMTVQQNQRTRQRLQGHNPMNSTRLTMITFQNLGTSSFKNPESK